MENKIINLYVCPVCHKEYKRKGKYLSQHLKKCNAIAWIPKIRFESTMSKFEADKFTKAIDLILNGSVSLATVPIERIKKAEVMTNEMMEKALGMKALFDEWKEHPIELIHVPESELHQIYNVVV